MTSGLPNMNDDIRNISNGSINSFFSLRDSGLSAFLTPQIDAPGQIFRYCSGATPQALVGVLQRATNQNLRSFANEHLFEPLGMNSVRWDTAWDGSPFGGLGIP